MRKLIKNVLFFLGVLLVMIVLMVLYERYKSNKSSVQKPAEPEITFPKEENTYL